MFKNRIIVGFSNNRICSIVCKVLNKYGISPDCICNTGIGIRKMADYFNEGIIICGDTFYDEPLVNIVEDLWQNFNIILIGKYDKINICEDNKAYKLVTPLKMEELIGALELKLCEKTFNRKNLKDRENLLESAKIVLFKKYNFNEAQAHKYMQKLSMEKGKKLTEIAQNIIKNKGETI